MRKWPSLVRSALLVGALGTPAPGVPAADAPASSPVDGWRIARPDYDWSFPEDHWARSGFKTEWWYFTGHLTATADPSRRFGYQFTFFRIGLLPDRPALASDWTATDLIMGHAAITDLSSGRHVFSELRYRAVPFLGGFNPYPDPVIAWSRGPAGTEAGWTLRWNGEAFDLDMQDDRQGIGLRLSTRPSKPIVLHGPNGFSRKAESPGRASHYYSFTRLRTAGTLILDGAEIDVQGESWMDKEFGTGQLAEHQVGWDWFSLQLDDGRDVMLTLLRDAEGATDFARGTLVLPSGETRTLGAEAFAVRVTATWRSPDTGAEYPSGWTVTIPSERLTMEVRPELAEQENQGRLAGGLFYWEGAVAVRDPDGRPLGQGYVELTGYGTDNRPAL